MIRSKVTRRREYINFYKDIPREKRWPFDLMKISWTATIIRVGWAMIPWRGPTFSFFLSSIRSWWDFHDASTCLPTMRRNRDWSEAVGCSLTQSTAPICARASDGNRVNPSPHDQRALCDAIISNARSAVTCPAHLKTRENIVPHRRKGRKRRV